MSEVGDALPSSVLYLFSVAGGLESQEGGGLGQAQTVMVWPNVLLAPKPRRRIAGVRA